MSGTTGIDREKTQSPHLQLDAAMFIFQLAKDLYPSLVAALWELIRNSAVAGMPEGTKTWIASQAAHIEMTVIEEKNGTRTLYLFDNGAGLTEQNRERMQHAGGGLASSERASGASKRQIGRLAAIALNSAFDVPQEELKHVHREEGMTYFSRTKEDVRLGRNVSRLDINMRCFISNHAFEYTPNSVPLNDPRLGPFKGRDGSFTLLVIRNFKMTSADIERELPYYLPRKADRQLRISVNGKPIKGPIIDTRRGYISENGEFEIYLGLRDTNSPIQHVAEGEIVICEADSACAVTTIRASATSVLQSYLRDERLCGVVFYRNLFGQTNTGRTSLNSLYWLKAEGRRFANYLNSSETRNLISGVLGSDIQPDGDAKTKEFDAVLRLLENGFGPATRLTLGGKQKTDKTGKEDKRGEKSESTPRDKPEKPEEDPETDPPVDTSHKKIRPLVLPIGGKQYLLLIEPNDRSAQVARQPINDNERTVTLQGNTYSVISVNPDWKGSREVNLTQRTNYMVGEILRVAAEYAARSPRARDEARTEYYVDVCKGAWRAKHSSS